MPCAAEIGFTYSSVQALMEFPCSQILQLSQIYSPSIGWRSSLKWSRLCCPPQTKSRSLWALWNRPGSIHIHRPQSSRSPCTSPQSCNSCLLWSWASRQRKDKSERWHRSSCPVLSAQMSLRRYTQTHTHSKSNLVCVHHHMFCLEKRFCFVKVILVKCLLLVWHTWAYQHGASFVYHLALLKTWMWTRKWPTHEKRKTSLNGKWFINDGTIFVTHHFDRNTLTTDRCSE